MTADAHSTTPGTAFVISHEDDPQRRQRSTSIIALAVTRSLGRQSVPVVRIHPNRLDHSLRSRYCSEIAISPDMYQSTAVLVQYLIDLAQRFPGPRVLIPASDDCAEFLGAHRPALEHAYRLCVSRPEVAAVLVNKRRQYEQATRFAIPIPETYFPESRSDVEQLAASIGNYPYIFKPLVAHTWRLASMQGVSRGRKAVLVRSADELRRAYRSLGEGRREVMLQEVIGGRDEQLFTFLGYFREDGAPLAYCVRKKIRQLPVDFGYCTRTVSCHDATVVEQSVRLMRGIGFSGICGVEYKFDSATGQYKLIEINPRPVNTIGLAPACGVDIPYIAYRDLAGEPVTPATSWRDGVTWYRSWADLAAVRQLGGRSMADMFEWCRSLGRAERTEALFASDDWVPAVCHYAQEFRTDLAGRVAKVLRPGRIGEGAGTRPAAGQQR
jgi:predicted ATP-grasp superfamily ATP-dependent carboligase